jgi:hypothetical protein
LWRRLGPSRRLSGRCVQGFEGGEHGLGEPVRVLFGTEVETVDLAVVPPLVEGWRGLIILETLQDGTVDDHLQGGRRQCQSMLIT